LKNPLSLREKNVKKEKSRNNKTSAPKKLKRYDLKAQSLKNGGRAFLAKKKRRALNFSLKSILAKAKKN
jgi:hypothetical protein